MLNKLKGSRTLILLVIANLPGAVEAINNVLTGVGQVDLATNIAKGVAGLLSVITVLARLIPEPEAEKK